MKEVVEVEIKGIVPTPTGVAVFLGNEEKVFTIYVDQSVGGAIGMFMSGQTKERPLTHDLMALMLEAFGARVLRAVINDVKSGTYFGRLIIQVENEVGQRKIIELDARPSDSIAMATQQKAPIYVSRAVWEEVEDMSAILEKMAGESEPEEDDET